MWQIQIKHDVARSVCYQFKDKLAEFLRATDGLPDDLNDLQERGIRIVVGDKNDPETPLASCRDAAFSPSACVCECVHARDIRG